jgi:hypothetical protein
LRCRGCTLRESADNIDIEFAYRPPAGATE